MSIYAVNSKEPIAAWIPSLDTAGNGTTTLNDLIGAKHATLTNFAMAGSTSNWVADTDAGGVRALDFDNSDDYADIGAVDVLPSSGALGLSWWEKITSSAGTWQSRFRFRIAGATRSFLLFRSSHVNFERIAWIGRDSGNYIRASAAPTVATSVGTWRHFLLTATSFISETPGDWTLYVDGSSQALTSGGGASGFGNAASRIGLDGLGDDPTNARLDDIRVWTQLLDSADVSYLYNSGSGRGRIPVTGESRRRRQSASGGVL
jgi:hypothetical protein